MGAAVKPDVLVVDDSLTVRMDLRDTLDAAGFAVTPCATLAEARRLLAERQFDLVVLDVRLPDGDGIDLLREIRERTGAARLPVMLLSTEADVRDRVRGMQTGADEYVGKPYDSAYVVARARMLAPRAKGVVLQSRRTVLVIDDSETFRAVIASALGQVYEVRTASSGEEGLRLAFDLRPDAIVVDAVLPGISGRDVVRRIRLDATLRATPCVLLTGADTVADELRGFDSGADAYVRKSRDAALVLARLEALFRTESPRSSLEPGAGTIGPKKILLVDDNGRRAEQAADALRGDECDVAIARSADEALELLVLQAMDVVVVDLRTTGLVLGSFCARLREVQLLRELPVLVRGGGSEIDALRDGADDWLSDSNDMSVLGVRVRAQLRRKQIADEARKSHAQAVRNDIETRKNAELERANEALIHARAENEEYTRFLVHDLKNPLAAISAHAQFLTRLPEIPPIAEESAQQILASTRRMTRLVMNLLDVARAEDGALPVTRVPIDIRALFADVVAEAAQRAKERQQTVKIDVQDTVPIEADDDMLRRTIANLLENAMKYAPADSTITLSATRTSDFSEISVADQGAGIPPHLRSVVFDKYVRLDRDSAGGARQSRGIGLAFCRRAAEAHRGTIRVEDAPGGGALFALRLPIAPSAGAL